MPRANIYIRESDTALFEQAQADLGENLSAMFVDCIRERLARKTVKTMNAITLSFLDDANQPTIKKTFTGRWILGDDIQPGMEFQDGWHGRVRRRPEESVEDYEARQQAASQNGKRSGYSVAITEKGQIAIYSRIAFPEGPPRIELEVVKTAEKLEKNMQLPLNLRLAILRLVSGDSPIDLDI